MRTFLAACSVICATLAGATRALHAQTPGPAGQVLDPMDNAASWKVITPEGVRLSVHEDDGVTGRCLRLDYEFVTGAGYCIIQKDLPVTLPDNYEFAFQVRGQGPDNNLEFKLLDEHGDSVWWVNRRALEWPAEWTRLSNKKRRLEFAWGPSGGAPLTRISKIEFAVASSSGGKGSVWLDELTLRQLPPLAPARPQPPTATASSSAGAACPAANALDGDKRTTWSPAKDVTHATLDIDQHETREFGGVRIHWRSPAHSFKVLCSDDGEHWTTQASRTRPAGQSSLILLPDAEARFVRLDIESAAPTPDIPCSGDGTEEQQAAIEEVEVLDAAVASSPNAAFEWLASHARRGAYPRYFSKEASYWTVVGAHSSLPEAATTEEALVNEDGLVEVGKKCFSVEPFLVQNAGVSTWADAEHTQRLAAPGVPFPITESVAGALLLETTVWTEQNYGVPWLMLRYRLKNTSHEPQRGMLALAVRPFQVNPTYQWLNTQGGFTPIREITPLVQPDGEYARLPVGLRVSTGRQSRDVHCLTAPTRVTLTSSDEADVLEAIADLTSCTRNDPQSHRSAVLWYQFDLAPDLQSEYVVAVPLHDTSALPALPVTPNATPDSTQQGLDAATRQWQDETTATRVIVPPTDRWMADTFAAQLAYVLVNRDGPALQPGSRSYERSWARDGSLTSAALLACGRTEEARAWIDWFGAHQFENGKVPCVVDSRGPDPVNEYDSNGEYIWAVANYYRYSHDTDFLARHYPRVQKTVAYIDGLRSQRRTQEYQDVSSPKRAMYGLVPESISHEGYSAKPMHSYWDDFFILLGLKEAAYIAEQMHDDQWAQAYAKYAVEFRGCLYDSMRRVFAEKHIAYIPGCVELGDFDSTSTTIALFPCAEQDHAPQAELRATFDRYWEFAQGRMHGQPWEAFTPYELRHAGAFVRLGQPERAYELLQWFHQFQRPEGWHHWAEVVWHDPRTPRFIGDMPHTWVGSDYLNSVLSMFACDRADSPILFAGVPASWIDSGDPVGIDNLHTPYGVLNLRMQRRGPVIHAEVTGNATPPVAGFTIRRPPHAAGQDIVVRSLPAEATWNAE
ncbi:MAG: discoidin domain-containing protein [Phycisphaerales bacterium]